MGPMYGAPNMWGPTYGSPHIWGPIYRAPYMGPHVRGPIYGAPYMTPHTWSPTYRAPYMAPYMGPYTRGPRYRPHLLQSNYISKCFISRRSVLHFTRMRNFSFDKIIFGGGAALILPASEIPILAKLYLAQAWLGYNLQAKFMV